MTSWTEPVWLTLLSFTSWANHSQFFTVKEWTNMVTPPPPHTPHTPRPNTHMAKPWEVQIQSKEIFALHKCWQNKHTKPDSVNICIYSTVSSQLASLLVVLFWLKITVKIEILCECSSYVFWTTGLFASKLCMLLLYHHYLQSVLLGCCFRVTFTALKSLKKWLLWTELFLT